MQNLTNFLEPKDSPGKGGGILLPIFRQDRRQWAGNSLPRTVRCRVHLLRKHKLGLYRSPSCASLCQSCASCFEGWRGRVYLLRKLKPRVSHYFLLPQPAGSWWLFACDVYVQLDVNKALSVGMTTTQWQWRHFLGHACISRLTNVARALQFVAEIDLIAALRRVRHLPYNCALVRRMSNIDERDIRTDGWMVGWLAWWLTIIDGRKQQQHITTIQWKHLRDEEHV